MVGGEREMVREDREVVGGMGRGGGFEVRCQHLPVTG